MTSEIISKPDQKFFFNAHVFDKDGQDLVEIAARNAAPPPPVFSEQDMETARKKAFAEGKAAAERAYMTSHEHRLALVLEGFEKSMAQLFGDEALREKLYEHEAVNLTLHVFEHLFPIYKNLFGFEELKAAVEKTILAHNGKNLIRIHVHSEMAPGIEEFIQNLCKQHPNLKISVATDDQLDVMACRMNWDHGGALRSTQAMALEIQSILQESLAATTTKGHDGNVRDDISQTHLVKAESDTILPEDGERQ